MPVQQTDDRLILTHPNARPCYYCDARLSDLYLGLIGRGASVRCHCDSVEDGHVVQPRAHRKAVCVLQSGVGRLQAGPRRHSDSVSMFWCT